MKQQNYFQVLGNTPRKSRFDPDLARQMNEEVEKQERLEELRRKRKAKKGKAKEETKTPEINKIKEEPIVVQANFALEDFILLKGKTHGPYSYQDLLVSMYRLGMSPEAEQVASRFGYQLANTAKESNGRNYIGNINWKQALSLNLDLGGLTLNPRQFADFLLLLKSGNAVDGTGRRVERGKLDEILDEIITVRDPYRAEWLDADFRYQNKKLLFYSEHILDANRNFEASYKRELESCLMVKGSRINLGTMNNQGMPVEEGNDFHYWCPDKDNKSVAWFGADSDRAGLSCCGSPTFTVPSLGVRLCVPKARALKN